MTTKTPRWVKVFVIVGIVVLVLVVVAMLAGGGGGHGPGRHSQGPPTSDVRAELR